MNMIEKIQMMMDERGIKTSDVAKGAGLPYTTVDGIFKKGYENMKLPTLRKLADFFGVSMEYLVNDEETDRTRALINHPGITEDQKKLLHLWDKLPRDEQMKMIGRIEATIEKKEL